MIKAITVVHAMQLFSGCHTAATNVLTLFDAV